MTERTLESRYLYQGRVVNLRLDTVDLGGGKTTLREIVEHRGSVAIVAIDADGRLLLVRQFRKPVEKILLEIPAGTLDAGEAPEECAARELREETGYRAGRIERLGGFYSSPGFCTEYLYIYLAQELAASPLPRDSDEDIEVLPIPLSQIPDLIASGELCDAKSIAAIHMALRRSPSASA